MTQLAKVILTSGVGTPEMDVENSLIQGEIKEKGKWRGEKVFEGGEKKLPSG